MIDFSRFDDEQLDQLRVDVLTEQERRANLAQIPETIQELATKYTDGGGKREDLLKAVDSK